MNTYVEPTSRDVLTVPQRLLEPITIVAMLMLFGFFVYHQQANSGFFTEKFGGVEMICLYVPIVLAWIAPAVRAWTGRRNPARPYEIATNLFMAIGALWLLIVFPFNFSHLADTLPAALHFLLAWVPEGLGKLALIIQIIVGPISALLTAWRYFSNRRRSLATA